MSLSPFPRGVSAGALILALTVTTCALAQEILPPIEVGSAQPNGTDLKPPETIYSGSLTAPSVAEQKRRLEQTVGSVAFVDAASPEMQTRHIADLRDALKDVPGVFVDTRYGQELRLSDARLESHARLSSARLRAAAGRRSDELCRRRRRFL